MRIEARACGAVRGRAWRKYYAFPGGMASGPAFVGAVACRRGRGDDRGMPRKWHNCAWRARRGRRNRSAHAARNAMADRRPQNRSQRVARPARAGAPDVGAPTRSPRCSARVEGILDARRGGAAAARRRRPTGSATAFRWRKRGGRGYLQAIRHPHAIAPRRARRDRRRRSARSTRNTRQFVAGLPANNVLLTGSRGTGKSSLVKAMLVKYAAKGLRLIEVDKGDLVDLPDIADVIEGRGERFIVFCDDLTFDAGEPGYKALKVMLDGTVAAVGAEHADLRDVRTAGTCCPSTSARTSRRSTSARKSIPANRSRRRSRCPSASACGSRSIRSARTITSRRSPAGSTTFGVGAPKSAREARGAHARGAAVRAAARLAQRPHRLAVRQELRRRRRAEAQSRGDAA